MRPRTGRSRRFRRTSICRARQENGPAPSSPNGSPSPSRTGTPPDGFSFGYHYAGSPLVVGGQEQPEITLGGHRDTPQVGFRLPHVWLDDGQPVLDVLGPDFTVLRTDPAADVLPWLGAARALGVPLTVAEAPGRYPAPLLLVRPDQHIAWMGGAQARPREVLRTVTGRVAVHPR